jgi:hypothetical protein
MQIARCDLKILEKEDFAEYEYLKGLWLDGNQIVTLNGDVFANLQGLEILSLFNNKIKYIERNLLDVFKCLKRANFKENTCIDFEFDENDEQLAQLKKEIATKCEWPPKLKICSITVAEHKKRRSIEERLKELESCVEKQTKNYESLMTKYEMLERKFQESSRDF